MDVMQDGFRIVERGDEEFPAELSLLGEDRVPVRMWIRGRIPPPPRIAIVGTRRPDVTGIQTARLIAAEAVDRGWAVVSGGAIGIDTAAHEAAIAAGGLTAVVMGTGPDGVYPAGNAGLFDQIVCTGGGIMTEMAPGATVKKHRFLERNRIIAALGLSVVVVQAGYRSGALSTARWAQRAGVALFAVPGSPLSRLSEGTNLLILRGEATILTRIADPLSPPAGREGGVENPRARLARLVGAEPVTAGELALEAGIDARRVQQLLLDLEIDGSVMRTASGRYVSLTHQGKECNRPGTRRA